MASDARDALAVIPWYWRDWRASKARAFLVSDPPALMAYREILDAMWGETNCSVPDDDETLAALAGLTLKAWKRVREKVMRFLIHNEAGRVTHPRSQHEYRKALAYREGCRAGGNNRASTLSPEERGAIAKKGADARWASKQQESTKQQDACSMLADACTPSPSPSPSLYSDSQSQIGSFGTSGVEAKPKRSVSPQEATARRLGTALGSTINICRKQVAALVANGWDLPRIGRAIEAHARPGMAPWEWTRRAQGENGTAKGGASVERILWMADQAEEAGK